MHVRTYLDPQCMGLFDCGWGVGLVFKGGPFGTCWVVAVGVFEMRDGVSSREAEGVREEGLMREIGIGDGDVGSFECHWYLSRL